LKQTNNFDFLRIVFSIFVIITHAYPLSGMPSNDWISQISDHQMSFSYLGVAGFFAISGYLVMQSLSRSSSLKEYFLKRILRIYPALIGVLVLTVLLGPFVYSGSLANYLHNSSVWSYVPFNLTLFKLQYSIKGIFEDNPYASVINGSLCTLPYEVLLYLLLSALFYLSRTFKGFLFFLSHFVLLCSLRLLYTPILLKMDILFI